MMIIAIAGGSGSGKSTLAVALCRKYPNTYALLHIDDYFDMKENVPKLGELINWDDPRAVRFDDIYRDLLALKNDTPVTIRTKGELYNPGYISALKNKIEYTVFPKSRVILEGYLALHDERIRALMDFAIYLDMPIAASTKRRSENKFNLDPIYAERVLIPMHAKNVEPTRAYADLVIDVSEKTKEDIFHMAESSLFVALPHPIHN